MIRVDRGIVSIEMNSNVRVAGSIPALDHAEAGTLARVELGRFTALVETLGEADWGQATDCSAWTVRDILAHQAGAHAAYTSWKEFVHQMSARPGPGQMVVDAVNARQLANRRDKSPTELIAELRRVGPGAIQTRQRLPWLLRKLPVPFGPPVGTRPVEYLTDTIYTRDTWSHRLDICRACRQPFEQTADHDGRIVALVLRELDRALQAHLNGQSVVFDLAGAAGGRYRLGGAVEPSAVIAMDVLEFGRLASDRLTPEEGKRQGLIAVSGDRSFADRVLAHTSVLF